jgi:CheY-like chemotaxis protein
MNKLAYIDDSRLDHFILKKILSRFGSPYEVKCSSTGNSVLYLLSRYRMEKEKLPEMVMIDIHAEEFDAWEFLAKMKALYPGLARPVEVYVLSASKYPEDIERLKQYSFVKAFIVKPITREVMLQLIQQKKDAPARLSILESQN